MIGLHDIYLSQTGADVVPIDALADSHGVTEKSARVFTRFFGQTGVRLTDQIHRDMMRDALAGTLARHPELRDLAGVGIYTKTQTHNTFFEQDWLREIFDELGLAQWEAMTFSMTNCASGLAAVHLGMRLEKPFIILAGEKAFHPVGNRLSVGLLGEAAVSSLFCPGGKHQIRSTHVAHLPRYHINPDDMADADRKALQTDFEAGLTEFLSRIVDEDAAFFARNPVVVPYNLNPPLVNRVMARLGLDRNLAPGTDTSMGHMFCSDVYLSVASDAPSDDQSLFLFSAGHGVSFAAMKLEPASHSENLKGQT